MEKVSVTLSGPAKIDGKREPAGKTVSVTTNVARQLAANGVIAPPAPFEMSDTPLASDFDAAVADAVSAALAEAAAKSVASLAEATSRADAAGAKIAELETALVEATGRANQAEAKAAELEAVIAASTNTGAGKKPADKKA